MHDTSLFEQIPEELMQESPFEQRRRERFIAEGITQGITQGAKEATLKNRLTVLNAKFHVESVRALMPALENIDDLERLAQLHLTATAASYCHSCILLPLMQKTLKPSPKDFLNRGI